MNLPVVSLFLLMSVTLTASISPAQTTHRRVSNSTLRKPRDATVKICQGLPIPDGYIITAYMTTSACPHGAYVIKKQDTYSESSVAPNKKRDMEPRRSVAMNRRVRKPMGTSSSVSRPRRVGIVEPDSDIPSLRGAETTLRPNPSTLNGTTSIGTRVSASSN